MSDAAPPLTAAREVTPAELADATVTRTWDDETGPALWIHTRWWAYCAVVARLDWADGRVAYQVIHFFTTHAGLQITRPTYWWEPSAMRAAWRHGHPEGAHAVDLPRPATL